MSKTLKKYQKKPEFVKWQISNLSFFFLLVLQGGHFFWTPSESCISIIITHYNYKFPYIKSQAGFNPPKHSDSLLELDHRSTSKPPRLDNLSYFLML